MWAEKTIEGNADYAGGFRSAAASYGQLGRSEEAQPHLSDCCNCHPD